MLEMAETVELFAHAAANKTDLSKVDKGGVKQKDIN